MDTSGGLGTVITAVAVWPEPICEQPVVCAPLCVAVIVAAPAFFAVTTPVALTVATMASEEAKVELQVRSSVEESLKVPVTARGCVLPLVTLAEPGVTTIETRVGWVGALELEGWHPMSTRP